MEVDPTSEKRWTAMIDRGADRATFGEISYYFGTNIPGKPRKYLLNSGGRPKLLAIVAEQGKMAPEAAKGYVKELSKAKRYQRDVY